ncbi:assembly factor cbp4 [Myotisia sp. PD_48]|nr:assembly factor cbp4 [Myotisia sp. PD_48]
MVSARGYFKMFVGSAALIIGGPALVNYVRPTEEELFQRFNPDLQKRNLAMRDQRQQEYEVFVNHLKEHSKSDKNIWVAMKDAKEQQKKSAEVPQNQKQE